MDMSWIITVVSLIITTLISTIVSTAVKRGVDKKLDKSLNEQQELMDLRAEHERQQFNSDVAEVMKAELVPLQNKMEEISVIVGMNKEGTVILLREFMNRDRNRLVNQGYASASDIASWHELYSTYKKLGGNHFAEYVDEWKDDIDNLPRDHKDKDKDKDVED